MLEANTPDLFAILGDAPDAENLRTLGRVRRVYADRIMGTMIDVLDAQEDEPETESPFGRRRGRYVGVSRGIVRNEGARHANR